MAELAYEMAKLTTKSKQIDGMGFGGGACDNLVVAGALGMRNAETGKKLSKWAYNLARLKWIGDKSCRHGVVSRLVFMLRQKRTKLAPETLRKLCAEALIDFVVIEYKFDKKGNKMRLDEHGQPILKRSSNANIASRIGIDRKNYTSTHEMLFDKAFVYLSIWESDAANHLSAALKEN